MQFCILYVKRCATRKPNVGLASVFKTVVLNLFSFKECLQNFLEVENHWTRVQLVPGEGGCLACQWPEICAPTTPLGACKEWGESAGLINVTPYVLAYLCALGAWGLAGSRHRRDDFRLLGHLVGGKVFTYLLAKGPGTLVPLEGSPRTPAENHWSSIFPCLCSKNLDLILLFVNLE